MRKSQPHLSQTVKHAKFYEFKDLDYFKLIFKGTNDLQLKETLSTYIYKITTRFLDQKSYIYLPQKSIDGYEAGKKIERGTQILSKRVSLFRVSRHIDQILTKIVHLKIPVLEKLKTQNRFMILTQGKIYEFPFNRFIRKFYEPFDGIFYIAEGEIKITQNAKILRVIGKGNFFGLEQLALNKSTWCSTIESNCNEVRVWFLPKDTFDTIIDNDQKTIKQKLIEFYEQQSTSQNKTLRDKKQSSFRLKKKDQKINLELQVNKPQQKNGMLTLTQFLKRWDQFKRQTTSPEDSGFNQYLKKKKIIIKLEETMKTSKQKMSLLRRDRLNQISSSKQNIKNTKYDLSDHNNIKSNKSKNKGLTTRSDLSKRRILQQLSLSNVNQQINRLDQKLLTISNFKTNDTTFFDNLE